MSSSDPSNSPTTHPDDILNNTSRDASNIPSIDPMPPTQHEKSTDDDVEISDIDLRELYNIARGSYDFPFSLRKRENFFNRYNLKRFPILYLFDIYCYQHELMKLDEKLALAHSTVPRPTGLPPQIPELHDEDIVKRRNLLKGYCKKIHCSTGYFPVRNRGDLTDTWLKVEAIKNYKEISQMSTHLNSAMIASINKTLARKLNTKHYTHASDAFSMLSISPWALGVEEDNFRNYEENHAYGPKRSRLQSIFPTPLLYRNLFFTLYSPSVLILPIIFLDWMNSDGSVWDAFMWENLMPKLIVWSCTSVFLSILILPNVCNVSFNQILVAAATYMAVLVVFITRK